MDHTLVSGIEHPVILSQRKRCSNCDAKIVHKEVGVKRNGIINPQNYNYSSDA